MVELDWSLIVSSLAGAASALSSKKTDVAEHSEGVHHVGLLVNWLPGPAG
jgi:hypothetical protein